MSVLAVGSYGLLSFLFPAALALLSCHEGKLVLICLAFEGTR